MRRVVTAALAGTAALAAGAGLATGCGGGDAAQDDRARVEGYVERANVVQRRAQPRIDAANATYEAWAKRTLKGAEAELALRQAELDLAGVEQELAALRPPEPARELHRRLLRTYELRIGLAAETRAMAGYVPRAERALAGLNRVRTRLRDRLRDARTAPQQVAALTAYGARLAAVQARLERLEVPPVLTPTHRSQVARLRETRALATRLARAIARKDAARVAKLLRVFRQAGGPDPVGDRLAEGAIAAYQQRVARVGLATGAVQREQARLIARR